MQLVYNFQIAGEDRLLQTFESIEQRAGRTARVESKSNAEKIAKQREINELKKREAKEAADLVKKEKAAHNAELKQIKDIEKEKIQAAKRVASEEEKARKKAIKAVEQAERSALRERQQYARTLTSAAGRSLRGSIGTAARVVAGVSSIVGGIAVGDSVARGIDDQKRIKQLVLQGNHAVSDADVNSAVTKEAINTGTGKADLISGLSKFVSFNGDLKLGVSLLETMNTAAVATGASLDDIAEASAQAFAHGHIKDAGELGDILAVWAEQGKKGTFELKDLASQMSRIGALYENMGLGTAEGLKVAGGISQIVRGSVGGPEQAVTAQEHFKAQLTKHSADLQAGKFGSSFKVFTDAGKTHMADIRQQIPGLLAATSGNQEKLQKILGAEGMAFINPFLAKFNDTAAATKGSRKDKSKAGSAAVTSLLNESINANGATFDTLVKDAKEAQDVTQAKIAKAKAEFDDLITKELIPVINDLIPKFKEMIPTITNLVKQIAEVSSWLLEHPKISIFGFIAGKLVADVAAAGFGQAITNKILSLMGGNVPLPTPAVPTAVSSGVAGAAGSAIPAAEGALGTTAAITGGAMLAGAGLLAVGVGGLAYMYHQDKDLHPNYAPSAGQLAFGVTPTSTAEPDKKEAKMEKWKVDFSAAAEAMERAAKIQLEAAEKNKANNPPLPNGRNASDPH